MPIRSFALALPLASFLLAAGCQVNVYHSPPADPHADRLQRVTGGNYLIHPLSDPHLCFDVRGDKAAANTEVWLYGCHGRENQRWAFVDQPGNASTITGVGGLCLDVAGGQSGEGTPVNIHPCGASQPNQTFRHFENGQFREMATGKCLSVGGVAEGQRVVLATCAEGNPGQVWALTQ